MWNVYADINGEIRLIAEDCGSEESAWDVVEYIDHVSTDEYHGYPLFVQFDKTER